jgi:ankyrin repeat protein
VDFDEISKAIKKGDVVQIRHELESGLDADLTNQYGWTLLMLAALEGNTAVGRELIRHGARLERRNNFGATALSLATETGHPGFVELLLQSGATLDGHPFGSSFEDFVNWASQYGSGSRSPEAMAKTRAIIKLRREAEES